MTDSEKLRTLAKWFDGYDFSSKAFLNHNEVQTDLLRIADELEQKLGIPAIMQAEGSDVSDGAAVGNSAAGKGVSADEKCPKCGCNTISNGSLIWCAYGCDYVKAL